jgi:hypothetical protein
MRSGIAAVLVATCALLISCADGGGQSLTIEAAHGSVQKAEKDSLTVQPRATGGKFGKNLVLKITGTSKVSAVAMEKRGGKLVPVQRDVEPAELEAGQAIAVIYIGGGDAVLLSAVVQRGAQKK